MYAASTKSWRHRLASGRRRAWGRAAIAVVAAADRGRRRRDRRQRADRHRRHLPGQPVEQHRHGQRHRRRPGHRDRGRRPLRGARSRGHPDGVLADRQLPQRSHLRHRRPQLHRPSLHQQRVRRLADDHHQPDDLCATRSARARSPPSTRRCSCSARCPRERPPTSPPPGNGSAPSARPASRARRRSAAGPRSRTTTRTTKARPGSSPASTATGADASWQVLGAPAGNADVTIRYSNYIGGDGNLESRTESLVVNGTTTQVTLPTTSAGTPGPPSPFR